MKSIFTCKAGLTLTGGGGVDRVLLTPSHNLEFFAPLSLLHTHKLFFFTRLNIDAPEVHSLQLQAYYNIDCITFQSNYQSIGPLPDPNPIWKLINKPVKGLRLRDARQTDIQWKGYYSVKPISLWQLLERAHPAAWCSIFKVEFKLFQFIPRRDRHEERSKTTWKGESIRDWTYLSSKSRTKLGSRILSSGSQVLHL